MSHSHIRIPKAESTKIRPLHLILVGAPLVLLCACLPFLWNHFGAPQPQDGHATVSGAILDTRVAVDRIRDGGQGGYVLYRLEAHVKFRADGRDQDRWLVVPSDSFDRLTLMAKAARHPKTCLIYWTPGHLENAKCKMDLY